MTNLEILERVENEKCQLAHLAQTRIKEGYEKLVRNALEKNNFNMQLVNSIAVDVSSRELDNSWSRDYIEVRLKNEEDYMDLDIYIRDDKVQFNNCCSGNWSVNDIYYQYVKLMAILAQELNQSLLTYSRSIDRQPLKDADEARWAVGREEQRIRDEEHEKSRQAKIKEIDGAEYIAKYRNLRSWEEGYVEGENKQVISELYRIIKKTPKRFYVEEYRQYGDDNTYTPSPWYRDEQILKKEDVYNPNWKAVTKSVVNIKD